MQCLLFSHSEEEKEGEKMGRRRKEKNCIHPASMFTSAPLLFLLLLSSHLSPLLLPLFLHFHPLFSCLSSSSTPPCPPPFADQNQLSPSLLLELFSSLHSFISFSVGHCFLPPFLSYQKNSSHSDTHFHTEFLCVHICLSASFCERKVRILSGKFFIFQC